jgi:2'-5' RNA ligase
MRLFLGIAPDAATRDAIGAARSRLESALGPDASKFKWTHAGNVHVTLHFLGEVPAARVGELGDVLGAPVPEPPFLASTGRFGAFPDRGAPRVIWLGVDRGADRMTRLHAICAGRLRQLGMPVEERAFTPHFTLGRARDRHGSAAVRGQLARMTMAPAAWEVAGATLFRSDLSGPAPRYDALVQVPLVGRP